MAALTNDRENMRYEYFGRLAGINKKWWSSWHSLARRNQGDPTSSIRPCDLMTSRRILPQD